MWLPHASLYRTRNNIIFLKLSPLNSFSKNYLMAPFLFPYFLLPSVSASTYYHTRNNIFNSRRIPIFNVLNLYIKTRARVTWQFKWQPKAHRANVNTVNGSVERLGVCDVLKDLEGDTKGPARAEYGQECEFLPYAPRRSGHSYSCHGASAHSAEPNVKGLSCAQLSCPKLGSSSRPADRGARRRCVARTV